jgi:hypothetical protein
MKRLVYLLISSLFVFSSSAQTGQIAEAKNGAYSDSALTAEMKSRRLWDEFSDQIYIDCPVMGNFMSTIHLVKKINKNVASYYLDLMTQGSTLFVGWKGAILVFTDGTKLKMPNAEIDIEVSDYGFRYTSSISLSRDDLKVLSSKNIDKFRLNIFDGEVNSKDSRMFRIYAKNIVKLK